MRLSTEIVIINLIVKRPTATLKLKKTLVGIKLPNQNHVAALGQFT